MNAGQPPLVGREALHSWIHGLVHDFVHDLVHDEGSWLAVVRRGIPGGGRRDVGGPGPGCVVGGERRRAGREVHVFWDGACNPLQEDDVPERPGL